MTRPAACTICRHPDRVQIEMLRLSGVSLMAVSAKFSHFGAETVEGGRDRLHRHMRAHVRPETKAILLADVPLTELAERAAREGASLLDHRRILRADLMQLYLRASGAGDARRAVYVAGRLVEVLREIGELTGEMLRHSPVTNINNHTTIFTNSAIIVDFQNMIFDKLAGHPDALKLIIAGIADLEAKATAKVIEGEHARAA